MTCALCKQPIFEDQRTVGVTHYECEAQLTASWRADLDKVAAQRDELLAAAKKAKQFIYYARYELQPGKAVLGDQFPKQDDADNVTAIVDAAIAKAEGN